MMIIVAMRASGYTNHNVLRDVRDNFTIEQETGKIVHLISRFLKLDASNVLLLDEPLNHLSFKNSKVLNELLREEIKVNPNLVIIMVSHCRAMDFTDRAMVYNQENRSIQFKSYRSYDCFTIDDSDNDNCSRYYLSQMLCDD